MLIQFSCSNFMSIRDEATLSLLAGADKAHPGNVLTFRNERILSHAAIYGANASGKSNVVQALAAAVNIVRKSNSLQISDEIPDIVPFLLDDESRLKPTTFDFIFTYHDVKYSYGFSADKHQVYEEYLYAYRSNRASKIFERTETNHFSFTKANTKAFGEYAEKTTPNKLFLATATAWNCKQTRDPYLWFVEKIATLTDLAKLESYAFSKFENNSDENLKAFMIRLLKNADINISDCLVKMQDVPDEDMQQDAVFAFLNQISGPGQLKKIQISMAHQVETSEGEKQYALPLQAESMGTQRLFFYGPLLKETLEQGKTLVIDEIDRNLHPLLVESIVDLFCGEDAMASGAQLIFTTQDVSLLSLKNFRRDQIYFTEKDNQTGATELYALDEFSPRKAEDIRKGYLQGRYGAIPMISLGGLLS
jgi:AAA15 family ATPase/GTPase